MHLTLGARRDEALSHHPSLLKTLCLHDIRKFTWCFITELLKVWSPEGSISITLELDGSPRTETF